MAVVALEMEIDAIQVEIEAMRPRTVVSKLIAEPLQESHCRPPFRPYCYDNSMLGCLPSLHLNG